ncbi:polysaccharide biosynthesis/export family protein [Methylocystis sp. JAN1]|uniref:polysaccharide biosynthesis/export family protein n=1 Tax=Methylocystis sp. JAN1 TaxID=3397211 RepID=UPI003FA20CC6
MDEVYQQGGANTEAPPPFELVEFDMSLLDLLKHRASSTFSVSFRNEHLGPSRVKIGPGDLIGLSVYESSAGGLFTPSGTETLRQGNYVSLPQQVVEQDGTISMPYGGRIPVKGKSTKEVESLIVSRLEQRAIEPQIVVSLLESRSSLYSVLGEVQQPGRFPINWAGEKLLAGISRAGGPKWPDFETSVTLTRGRRTEKTMLSSIINDPREDIYLKPGDSVYLRREPRFFTALGATGKSGQYPLDVPRLTLAGGMGRAQGLLDTQADPTGVFLLRWEPPTVLSKLGRDVTRYSTARIPTIYHIDLRNPTHMLASQQIELIDNDVIYVTNATTVEIRKALQVFVDLSLITANSALATYYSGH